MNMSTLRVIKCMNGSGFFSKARYMIGVGFEILARTLLPVTLPTPLPPPHRAPNTHTHARA